MTVGEDIILPQIYIRGIAEKEHLIHRFAVPLLPFRLNGRGVSFAGSLLPLPCGVTRHSKTIINCFRTAYPPEKAFEGETSVGSRGSTLKVLPRRFGRAMHAPTVVIAFAG